jgi:two-component system chemotaxis response regulator CheB
MDPVRVLVVDDSAFMRKAISMMLESDPEIKVVGMARNGIEGVDFAKRLKPDVITLDIEMPQMDGLTALKHIMKK